MSQDTQANSDYLQQDLDPWSKDFSDSERAEIEAISKQLAPVYRNLLAEEKIPLDSFFEQALKNFYLPLCRWLLNQHTGQPLVLGVNGAQGSGKSTLVKILSMLLQEGFGKTALSLSIDDFYKTREQRRQMSLNIHPLFETRGVPGTHDVELGTRLIHKLKNVEDEVLRIPRFDKSIDDRLPDEHWQVVSEKCDFILFEGWCVGAQAENDQSLVWPINDLERHRDTDSSWRNYVNRQLKKEYRKWFSLIDILLMLKIPSFEKVFEWRQLQEQKLRERHQSRDEIPGEIMNDDDLKEFIMHYQRVTEHSLMEMPGRADLVIELDDDHRFKYVIDRYGK